MVFLVQNRKDIQPVGGHPLSCFCDGRVDVDRFHRMGHDILGQQRRTIVCRQQLNDLLFDF